MKKKALSILLTLVLCLVLLPTAALAVTGSVEYLNDQGTKITHNGEYTELVNGYSGSTTWSDGWYVVTGNNVVIDSLVTVDGTVNLILANGCNLTVNGGINVASGKSLTIYGQSVPILNEDGTVNETSNKAGKLTATGSGYQAGIGGGYGESGGESGGTITINGGVITASGGSDGIPNAGCHGAGIGGGGVQSTPGGSGGTITINGGVVNATGGNGTGTNGSTGGGAGIGGGGNSYTKTTSPGGSGGTITINGGTVTATSGMYGAGIGGGGSYYGTGGSGGNIEISGGTVTANGGNGAGIGGGRKGAGGTVIISGGTVTATGSGGAGIGGGSSGGGGSVTISGGTVTATSSSGAGVGCGYSSSDKGSFTTGNSGGIAIIKANSISDQTNKASWSGIIFVGSDGGVYGTQTLSETFTVGSTENLLITNGAKLTTNNQLTNSGNVYVDGTLDGDVSGNVYYRLFLTNCTANTTQKYENYYAAKDTAVTLAAANPEPSKKVFDHWTVNGMAASVEDFKMPAETVAVTANFADALKITTQPENKTITYGGTTTLKVVAEQHQNAAGTLTYQWSLDGSPIEGATSADYTTPTDLSAVEHSYQCVVKCGNTYTLESRIAKVTVGKADSKLTAVPTEKTDLVYNGTEQALVTAGTTEDGEVQYALSKDGSYSADIPTGTHAGSYTVWYKVVGDGNHNDSTPASVQVTIARKSVTVSDITAENKTYDGKVTATLNCDNAKLDGKVGNDDLTVTATGTFADKDVGENKTVTITNLTLDGDSKDNYTLAAEGQQTSPTATISPKPVTVTIQHKSSVYGEAIAELTATDNGIVEGDIGVYTLSTTATSSSEVGSYDITGEGKSANYTFTFENGTGAYTITKATRSAEVTMEDWTYGDTDNEPVVTGNAENGTVTYRYKRKDDSGYLEAKPTDAGSYTVEATIAATANYEGAVVTCGFTIAQKELTVTGLTATDRVYAAGNTTVELTGGTLEGIVVGDENLVSAAMPTSGTIADAGADENKTVTFDEIVLDGDKKGNYILTQPTVTVNISQAEPDVGEVSYEGGTIYTTTELNKISLSKDGETAGTLKLTDGQTLTAGTADYGWTFTPSSTNYKTVTGTISLTVEADTLSSISASGTPDKTRYKYGEAFETTGLTVTATYASDLTKNVTDEVSFGALAVDDTSIELSYQGKTCTVSGLTVVKADARTLADISVSQKYTVTTEQSKEIGRAGMPANAGTLAYAQGTEEEITYVSSWNVEPDTGKVTFTLSGGVAGSTVTLPIKITSTNYADSTVNVVITLTDKETQADLTINSNTSVTFGETLTLSTTGGSGAGAVAYEVVSGGTGAATIDGNVLTPTKAGTVQVKAVKAADNDYFQAESVPIAITISKATPVGTPAYTAISTSGKTLADAALAVGSITPAGTIAWNDGPETSVTANTAFGWTFTPTDTANYNNLTGSITPYVVSYSGGGSSGGGGSSSSGTTTKNPDGSTTTTTTDKTTGTVTETTKNKDGSTTTVETKKDGTVTETVKTADGTTGTVVTNKDGNVTEAKAVISTTAAKEASKSGGTVTLPVEVSAAKNTGDAPSVEIDVSKCIGSVKVEIPVEKVTPGTVAVIVNADGTEKIISTSVVTDKGVALKVDGSTTVKVIDNAKSFNDVPASNVFYNEISSLSARNIMIGVSNEKFNLNGKVTLDQIANVAGRITGAVDVEDFNSGIAWGKTNGLKSGSDSATRGDVLKALYIAAGSPTVTDTSILAKFNDASAIPADMKAVAAWAAQNGILLGGTDGNANLSADVTRGQACALAGRTLNTIG